jgi:hypothetical protein
VVDRRDKKENTKYEVKKERRGARKRYYNLKGCNIGVTDLGDF